MTDTSSTVAQLLYAQRQQVTLNHRYAALVERGDGAHNDEYIDLYTEQLKQSTAELRSLTELIAQIKKILSRRKVSSGRNNHYTNTHHNNNIVKSQPLQTDVTPVTHSNISTSPYTSLSHYRQSSTPSQSQTKHKLDIWSHDYTQQDLPIGLRVAALTDGDSQPRMWIVAQIVAFKVRPRAMYEVADIDSDTSNNNNIQQRRKTYILDTNKIIPLPTLCDIPLNKRREFSVDQRILAVFPETTTLYPAYVVAKAKHRKLNTYLLRFDDDDVESREIDVDYCVPMMDEYAE